ncbi:hypothetical protein V7S43_011470 [Phytophthora oleae]|uniref:Transmembrane protein n=1 Tax=Phytophthora oleae TaxID=2107226 RepID=A0ABD3FA32_9STRA
MEEISLQDKDNLSFDMFNCSSDFSQNCYASMHTPPPPRSADPSNWTMTSSLRHTAILGEQKAKMPLLIRVRDVRLLAGAATFVAVLLLLVGVFSEGVPVGSRDTVASLNELNEYNFYTGTAAAMLAKPFEMALAFFVPVLSLVLSPRNSLQNDSVGWRALQFCAQGALTALLTGAFSTLNVQQLDPVLVPLIVTSDLSSSSSSGSTVTSSDLAFSLRPTADTLLRTAILPVYIKTTESVCQGRGGWPNIATTYAFFANDWLVDLLPDARKTEFSLHTTVGEAGSRNGSAIEGFNATLSANLLLYAMFFSQTLLAWEGISYLENSSLSQFQEELTSWRVRGNSTTEIEFQVAASAMLRQTLNDQSSRLGLAFDTNATSFNASRVTLSPDIEFDAVTIEIAFDEHAITGNESTSAAAASASTSASSSSSSLAYSLSSITDCGETTCLIPPPGNSFAATATLGDSDYTQWNVEPQIQAFAACVFEDNTEFMTEDYLHGAGCTRRSTTSLLVYSFGRRVVADDVTVETSSNSSRVVKATNMKRFHTITLGRLSWRTMDLSSDFNAACGVGNTSACMGLSFLLKNSSSTQHLVVGENHLPLDALGEFDGLYSRWTPLAMVTTPNDMQGDLLFRRNARSHSGDLDGQCSTSVDVFATQVEQNHWYMSFGLQESYTAALFLLFQNAVVREERQSVDGSRTLNFAGSSTHVTLEAQIPLPSALISIAGSALVLVGALCIVLAGRRTKGVIQRDLGVEDIAKVLLVDQRFPRLFLDCTLDDPDDRMRRPLHTFHISALVLHQEESPNNYNSNDAGIFIQYPPHS